MSTHPEVSLIQNPDVKETVEAIVAALPQVRLGVTDYGHTVGVMNPETGIAIRVAIAYRPERDGYVGYKYIPVEHVGDALEALRKEKADDPEDADRHGSQTSSS